MFLNTTFDWISRHFLDFHTNNSNPKLFKISHTLFSKYWIIIFNFYLKNPIWCFFYSIFRKCLYLTKGFVHLNTLKINITKLMILDQEKINCVLILNSRRIIKYWKLLINIIDIAMLTIRIEKLETILNSIICLLPLAFL